VADGPCVVDFDEDGAWDEVWDGHAVRKVDGDETRLSYAGLVLRTALACPDEDDGLTVTLENGTASATSDGQFSIDVGGRARLLCSDPDLEDASFDYTFDVSYAGRHEVEDGRWEGEGRYADSEAGLVDAQTADFEGVDVVFGCGAEPEAGRTILSTRNHEAILDLDGAGACDQRVPWTLDGVDQPALTATSNCSTLPRISPVFPICLAVLSVARRRPRRR
jgi:hypothetical protein